MAFLYYAPEMHLKCSAKNPAPHKNQGRIASVYRRRCRASMPEGKSVFWRRPL